MKNKMPMFLLALFAGAIIGAAIVWLSCNYCCKMSCCNNQCSIVGDTTGIHVITLQQAKDYFKAYRTNPVSVDTLIAFSINAEQFTAMKLIAKGDSTVHGFRIYMGMDGKTPVRMVVGTGSPDKVNTIYATTDVSSGPCPWVCDKASPITDR